jgi:DNA polymerase
MATAENAEIAELIADVREQVLYLRELGVGSMNVRLVESRELIVESHEALPPLETLKVETPVNKEPYKPGARLAGLPSLSKPAVQPVPGVPPFQGGTDETLFEVTPAMPEPVETIEQIRAEIGPDCTRCPLHALGRSRVVNSVGNFNADLMFAGEAPGADEDRLGEPFVGRAGQLLTKIIESIGLGREDVFIGNINRCRPPGNRAPVPEESSVCKPFLIREIAVVRPKVIVVLGATAAQNLLEAKVPIGRLRGHFHDYMGVKVMPTFHPAYLLRDPHKKREVWEDMKMVRDYLGSLTAK